MQYTQPIYNKSITIYYCGCKHVFIIIFYDLLNKPQITVSVCTLYSMEPTHANYSDGVTKLYNDLLYVSCNTGYKLKNSNSNDETTTIIQCLEIGIFNHTPVCDRKGRVTLCNNV